MKNVKGWLMFNEAINSSFEDFAKILAKYLHEKGITPVKKDGNWLLRDYYPKAIEMVGKNEKFASISIQDEYGLFVYVNEQKKELLEGIIKKYNLTSKPTETKNTDSWESTSIDKLNAGDLFLETDPISRKGDTLYIEIRKFE